MSETFAPDGVAGFQHDPCYPCWCEKRRGLTVEDIVRLCDDEGIDPRTVTRIAFFFLANPDVACAYGIGVEMSDWRASMQRNGKNVITKMVKEGCKRSVIYVYGPDKKPLGTVTYEPRPFDPSTGD